MISTPKLFCAVSWRSVSLLWERALRSCNGYVAPLRTDLLDVLCCSCSSTSSRISLLAFLALKLFLISPWLEFGGACLLGLLCPKMLSPISSERKCPLCFRFSDTYPPLPLTFPKSGFAPCTWSKPSPRSWWVFCLFDWIFLVSFPFDYLIPYYLELCSILPTAACFTVSRRLLRVLLDMLSDMTSASSLSDSSNRSTTMNLGCGQRWAGVINTLHSWLCLIGWKEESSSTSLRFGCSSKFFSLVERSRSLGNFSESLSSWKCPYRFSFLGFDWLIVFKSILVLACKSIFSPTSSFSPVLTFLKF